MKCALFLRQPEQQSKECWRKFSKQFFKIYKEEIFAYLGYSPQVLDVQRTTVNNKQLFLAVMSVLYRTGMYEGTKEELADSLYAVFNTGDKFSTLLRSLYDDLGEYEDVLQFFKSYKKFDDNLFF